jgi:hypothetical protein
MAAGFLIAVLVALAAGAGITLYNILSGRNFLLDTWDKLRLASKSLSGWDAYCAGNSCRSDIVICLTTIPSRLPYLQPALKSLLYQSRAPARICLHLPRISRREARPYEPPEWLLGMRSVEVVRCEDHGPATKLIPALKDAPPERKLLIVDDDKLYPPDMVERFHRWAEAYPDAAIGSSGWIVPGDLTDRPVSVWRDLRGAPPARLKATQLKAPTAVDIIQGHSGYLVRSRFFDAARLIADYAQAPPEAFFVDDIWISAYCTAPKLVLPAPRFCFVSYRREKFYKWTSLGRLSRSPGDPERHHNTLLIRYLHDRWATAKRREDRPEPP